jgi:hypothetical protein
MPDWLGNTALVVLLQNWRALIVILALEQSTLKQVSRAGTERLHLLQED